VIKRKGRFVSVSEKAEMLISVPIGIFVTAWFARLAILHSELTQTQLLLKFWPQYAAGAIAILVIPTAIRSILKRIRNE
jgi:hypothetical protein